MIRRLIWIALWIVLGIELIAIVSGAIATFCESPCDTDVGRGRSLVEPAEVQRGRELDELRAANQRLADAVVESEAALERAKAAAATEYAARQCMVTVGRGDLDDWLKRLGWQRIPERAP